MMRVDANQVENVHAVVYQLLRDLAATVPIRRTLEQTAGNADLADLRQRHPAELNAFDLDFVAIVGRLRDAAKQVQSLDAQLHAEDERIRRDQERDLLAQALLSAPAPGIDPVTAADAQDAADVLSARLVAIAELQMPHLPSHQVRRLGVR